MNKSVKIVLMTKNERYLIKSWIKYHGDIFGYENLYIIDDSNDVDILKYYQSLSHLPIKFYINNINSNLNTLTSKINEIMESIKNECDFMIKLDTDEFIGVYDIHTNDVFIDKEIVRNSFNNLIINGYRYKCGYTINIYPTCHQNNPLDYEYFSHPATTNFKTFFNSKTFLSIDLGSHDGSVIAPYQDVSKDNKTDIMIIHYQYQNFQSFMNNCKQAIISHGYIHPNDSKDLQIQKLSMHNNYAPSFHKVNFYLRYLCDPKYSDEYYNEYITKPDKYKFDKLKNLFINDKCIINNDKCIIITTINIPSEQVLHYTNLKGWDLIVVGDKKTNNALYQNINCIYLGLEEQKELFPSIYDKIPLNSYARKMFGYLYAIKHKYKIIYDTDDDNKYTENINSFQNNFKLLNDIDFPSNDIYSENILTFDYLSINDKKINKTETATHFTFDKLTNNVYLKYSSDDTSSLQQSSSERCISGIFKQDKLCSTPGFVNLYKIYTDSFIWPRGIPPKHSSIEIVPELSDVKTDMKCVVIQGLVNNDPDVDAHYRIAVNNKPFNFDKNEQYNIILDKYSVCPFNTQNTFWTDCSMFYAMYLPVSVTFRYTDILRGFIALYQLWKNDKTIKFTFPTAIQDRNEHDLTKDYESEISMYNTAELVIELLNNNKNATIQEMYSILEQNNIVDKTELDVLNEWMNIINGLNN